MEHRCFTSFIQKHPLQEVRVCARLDPQNAIQRNSKVSDCDWDCDSDVNVNVDVVLSVRNISNVYACSVCDCVCVSFFVWMNVCVYVWVCPWPDSPLDKYGAIFVASQTLAGRDAVVHSRL